MKKRVLEIIKVILSTDKVLTITEIADRIKVSNKTNRNDLRVLEKLLEEYPIKLIIKTGIGIYVEGREKDKLEVLSLFKAYKGRDSQYIPSDRQLYILYQLLLQEKRNTISSVQKELFISRPSIYKDLEKVKDWLARRGIQLKYDKKEGFVLVAGEKRIRTALFDFFYSSNEYHAITKNIESSKGLIEETVTSNYFLYQWKEVFFDVDLKKVKAFIKALEEKLQIKFTQVDFVKLTIKYAIAVSRMKKGHWANVRSKTLKGLMELKSFRSMEDTKEYFMTEFELKEIPVEELGYLLGITIACKTHYENKDWNINKKTMIINHLIAHEIIEMTKQRYHIEEETTLYNGLIHHLKSVTNKIKYGIDFHNENIKEIQSNHQESFEIALKCKPVFKKFYDFDIPDEEVAYIALHIAAAIERSKKNLNTYVVYHNDYSEIKLLIEYLKNNFKQINITMVIPMSMIHEINFDQVNLLITTIQLDKNIKCPSILLPTVLASVDAISFLKFVRELYEKYNKRRLKKCHNYW